MKHETARIYPDSGDAAMTERSGQASKKVFIKTYGCQMNVYDSAKMTDALKPAGYDVASNMNEADLVILNTCHIREKASEKVYSELGRIAKARTARRRGGQDTVVAVAGCVAQAEGEEMARRAPSIGLVIGPQSYHRLPELIRRHAETGRTVVETEFPAAEKFAALPLPGTHGKALLPTAFLTVQEGCDKFCTFCVVPYTRGAEYSRPVRDILEEARRLTSCGVKEITLLGQNVNAYRGVGLKGGTADLASLLGILSEIEGLERLRYTTSHPNDMTGTLIAAHGALPKLMPYLHLPFQAGSDRVLKAMNRKHGMSRYFEIVDQIRGVRPDLALSTDIIVGFPGETDLDFRQTLDAVERVRFAQAFSFKYSPRPGTPAASRDGQVSEEVKAARLKDLQAVLSSHQTEFNRSMTGRTLQVLWERPGNMDGQLTGRSPYLQAVHTEAPKTLLGQITMVEIIGSSQNSLRGVIKNGIQLAI